jgi:hypothetical protein
MTSTQLLNFKTGHGGRLEHIQLQPHNTIITTTEFSITLTKAITIFRNYSCGKIVLVEKNLILNMKILQILIENSFLYMLISYKQKIT